MRPRKPTDIERLEALAHDVAREADVELYDLRVETEGPRTVLRIFLEREGGVRLSDIESYSRKFGALLDVEDPVDGPYVLEVSSPGVNRRLTRPAHFARYAGHRVRVALGEPVEGARNFTGTLRSSDEEAISLEREDGTTYRLPYRLMRKANLETSQEELFGKGKKKR